ncbi:MOSC domain-containing protein [Congregicoccus parvus]|uniref:MOSC domain-containing protein n=1 Tax=Congregicoccus parvus TaxID=3081749 RepID=UPI003FA54A0D
MILAAVGEEYTASNSEACVTHVARAAAHEFHKTLVPSLRLLAGVGVEGDAHAGATVRHRSRVAVDPTQPNLRQVHLIHAELFDELTLGGFAIGPGRLGENITTRGVDLLGLPKGTRLHVGESVVLEITGLRNPCGQIEAWQRGLLGALLRTRADGSLERKAGVMSIVLAGGEVRPGDGIEVKTPPPPHRPLERV